MNRQIRGTNKNEMANKRKLMKAKSASMERSKSSIHALPLPAELVDEMFACLSLAKAFKILHRMPNFLLAKKVRKMLKSMEMAMKANKWNAADCGPKISIFQKGIGVKHSETVGKWNCIRSVFPIPKLKAMRTSIKFYFEMEILERNPNWSGISIGFCTRDFPLEGQGLVGNQRNSIGICYKGQIDVCGFLSFFGDANNEYFRIGDVVGVGIVHFQKNSPIKCFSACNGKLLGMVKLPVKFANLTLFPAVTLFNGGDSIKANFGSSEWRFNPRKILQELR